MVKIPGKEKRAIGDDSMGMTEFPKRLREKKKKKREDMKG